MADPKNYWYELIVKGNFEQFWLDHEEDKNGQLSSELKNLINGMLCYEPNKRLSIEQIKGHDWLRMESASPDQIRTLVKSHLNSGTGNEINKFSSLNA